MPSQPAVTLEAANRVVYAGLGALGMLAVHAGMWGHDPY